MKTGYWIQIDTMWKGTHRSTTHRDKGRITVDLIPAGKGNKCDKSENYKTTNAL